jgi:hypothetical protein
MLPVVEYPSIVEAFLPRLDGFLNKAQLKGPVKTLCPVLDWPHNLENKTGTGINNSFIGHNDQSALNNWLTESDWSEEKLDKARKELILEELKAKHIERCVLVVDGTLNNKTGKHMKCVKSFIELVVKLAQKIKNTDDILRYTHIRHKRTKNTIRNRDNLKFSKVK